jgi:hypothetical protein
MRVLFDHNVDRRFRRHLPGHDIVTTRQMGWELLANGTLLRSAADAGFEVVVTVDKKLRHEQNLSTLPLPVLLLDSFSNALPSLVPFAPFVLRALGEGPLERAIHMIARDGSVVRFGPTPGR